MPAPVDNGGTAFYFDADGVLHERATGLVVLDDQGNPVVWREPVPDPNEDLPADIATTWTVRAYLASEGPEAASTYWVVAESQDAAMDLWQRSTISADRVVLSLAQYLPANLAVHLRWFNAQEGDLSAIIEQG